VIVSKNGTFLLMRDYMDYHADRFLDFSTLVLDRRGEPVALFPANRVDSRVVSHGGLSYGGMLSGASMTTSQSLDAFGAWLAFCKKAGIKEVLYKSIPPIYHRSPADEDKYALFYFGAELYRREVLSVVDLHCPMAPQERRRRGRAKAEKSGLRVEESTSLDSFWSILAENLASRHGVRPVHTLGEIQLLHSRFPRNIRLFGVFAGDRMCAGTLLYYALPVVHAQYIAAEAAARTDGALDLLFLTLIEAARGTARYFDFGNSNEQEGRRLNRGLADFKEGFGARAICHDFYRIDPVREPPLSSD